MGLNLKIGNAYVEANKDAFPELRANWYVREVSLPDAPTFPHDELTGNTNCRYPTYSAWREFCMKVGLTDLFYDKHEGLMRSHPGCQGITQRDADEVTEALAAYRATHDKEPGFYGDDDNSDDDEWDPQLARLIWLEFWMQWAVKNCETPAFYNS